jgi:hypothetical protein
MNNLKVNFDKVGPAVMERKITLKHGVTWLTICMNYQLVPIIQHPARLMLETVRSETEHTPYSQLRRPKIHVLKNFKLPFFSPITMNTFLQYIVTY